MNVATLTALCLTLVSVSASLKERPVMKVVRLLQDMRAQLEKEKAEDESVFEQLDCWCKENDQSKTKAIELGQATMVDLNAALGEYAAKIEELREGLAATRTKLIEDQKALDTATTIRMQEAQAFYGEEKGLLEAVQACKQALVVLSKHHPDLAQLRTVVKGLEALGTVRMAKDNLGGDKLAVLRAFLQQTEGSSSLRRIPGMQSYAPQSGQINGILKQMMEEFNSDLSLAQKDELKAKGEFEALRDAKKGELAAGNKQLDQLEQDDAAFREKNVQAYEELNDTREQVATDQTFLQNLKKKCSATDEEFAKRTQSRLEEIAAVDDTIAFLNSDDAFENFDKTVNSAFVQTATRHRSLEARGSDELRLKAAQVLRRGGIPALVLLADSVRLDAFTKVKAAIDKMVEELTAQQSEEVEHRDWCKTELQDNDRSTEEKTDSKASLESQIADLEQTIKELTKGIKAKTDAIKDMEKEMGKAGDIREAENTDFQQTIVDQQLTQAILQKAVDRMRQVYALAQQPGAAHTQTSGTRTDPGNGPARFNEYQKNAGGGKIVVMIETILNDCVKMEAEANRAEQDGQAAYEMFMKDSNKAIADANRAITNLTEEKAKSEQAHTMAKSDLKDTDRSLEGLNSMAGDLHKSCDFVLQNFQARQEARTTEIEALREAKAILSGMN